MRSRRHSEILLWAAFGGVAFVAVGVAAGQQADPQLAHAAPWLITGGGLASASAGLVAWSTTGVVVAAGLWLCAGGGFLHALPSGTEGHGYWPLVFLAGLLLAITGVPILRHG